MKLKLSQIQKKKLIKAQYGLFSHSAVQICSWTKKSLVKNLVCYKEKFYGIDCHKCMQFTPLSLWCTNNCIFCWRPASYLNNFDKTSRIEYPKQIIENLIIERKKLLIGFKGNDKINKSKLEDAFIPNHFAVSLSGEPCLYPKLCGIIDYLKNKKKARTIFLVTNGQVPQKIEELNKNNCLPTQLYISVSAPTEEKYLEISRSRQKNSWNLFNKSLNIIRKLKCRTILRMTMINKINTDEKYFPDYANLIKKANPDFVEVKSYINIGESQKQLEKANQCSFEQIQEISKKLCNYISFDYANDAENSKICLLKNKNNQYNMIIDA
ncbi:MAG: 4-demethylwyosine synthase TYW1 [Candidatus Aenigmarchaeota archaeon ex4484_52]|nr:MAG: 4-demethylwyosine synthase TYW1 [Candidatus Aenigmarchaeota archaeon ex4484_52]